MSIVDLRKVILPILWLFIRENRAEIPESNRSLRKEIYFSSFSYKWHRGLLGSMCVHERYNAICRHNKDICHTTDLLPTLVLTHSRRL